MYLAYRMLLHLSPRQLQGRVPDIRDDNDNMKSYSRFYNKTYYKV